MYIHTNLKITKNGHIYLGKIHIGWIAKTYEGKWGIGLEDQGLDTINDDFRTRKEAIDAIIKQCGLYT